MKAHIQYYIYRFDDNDKVWKCFAGPYDNWPGEVAEQFFRDSEGREKFKIADTGPATTPGHSREGRVRG